MFDEMSFLFNVDPYIKNRYNTSSKTVNSKNPPEIFKSEIELDNFTGNFKLQKYIINKSETENYIKNDVNKLYTKNNPYLEYIKFCNEPNTAKSLKLSSTDFAYLRDIGVLPINRLMILRRYPEGTTVPVDLNKLPTEPIATIIGWVKKDAEILSFSFHEVWQTHTKPLDKLLAEIIKDEFGPDITSVVPIPGWGLGFMFQILYNMGLTEYNKRNIPIGDPNLLKESITRPHEDYGLESSFDFILETSYEQKYIAGVDPSTVHLEILNNLLKMGTSDVTVIGKPDSIIIDKLKAANANPTSGGGWGELVGYVFNEFVTALKTTLKEVSEDIVDFVKIIKDPGPPLREDNEKDKPYQKRVDAYEAEKERETRAALTGGTAAFSKNLTNLLDTELVKTILASTVARYQWPLRGSISMFTGEANTPWHLTIGNPYNPLLSMNNIYCSNVTVKYGKDMGFNDIPRTLDVTVTLKQGRSLGKQEIYSLFGISYQRKYKKV